MSSRADFFVGRGPRAEWLGSVAMDGYPLGLVPDGDDAGTVLSARDPEAFRAAVDALLRSRDDATFPRQGYPWPWTTPLRTRYVYALDGGRVRLSVCGTAWTDADPPRDDVELLTAAQRRPRLAPDAMPDMTPLQRVTFGHRSGAVILSTPFPVAPLRHRQVPSR